MTFGLHPYSRVFRIAWALCAGALGPASSAQAQAPPSPLAHLAPSDTGLYIELRRPDQVREWLRSFKTPRLFELFVATHLSDNGTHELLTEAFEKLFSREVALAAPDWGRISESVIVLRLPDPAAVEMLVGQGRSVIRSSHGSRVTVYETRGGLWLAADETFAIISQRGEESEFWRKAVALLEGTARDSLLGVRAYIGQVRQLGPDCAGYLYFLLPPTAQSRPSEGSILPFWPACSGGIVGAYISDRRIDLTFRGRLAHSRERVYRPRVSPDRLLHLPRTTLLAWETSMDLIEAYRRLVKAGPTEWGAVPASLLAKGPAPAELEKSLLSRLGPRVVVVWGQVATGSSRTPQLAVLVESSDAPAAADALATAVHTFLAGLSGQQGSTTQPSRVVRTEHLGVGVRRIPLEAGATPEAIRHGVEPCFAPLDGWLALALSVEHIEQIIDAERGLIPRLGDVTELGDVVRREQAAVTLVLAQPALCSRLLNDWITALSSGDEPFWRLIFPEALDAIRSRQRVLGIGVQASERPGCVHVARVYPGGPADGRLLPGDEIFAVDGRVLSVSEPSAELAQTIRGVKDSTAVTLRVWRGSETLDVPIALHRGKGPQDGSDPIDSLERLVRIANHFSNAGFAEVLSRPDQYVARLTLGFSPPADEAATQPDAR